MILIKNVDISLGSWYNLLIVNVINNIEMKYEIFELLWYTYNTYFYDLGFC